MSAEIDCVVVTDHNTGEWIDQLKKAYEQKRDNLDEGFRVHATKDMGRRDIPQYHRHAPP